jgi:hypothetical protein
VGLILKIFKITLNRQGLSSLTFKSRLSTKRKYIKKWLELQISKKSNRIEKTQCAEKKRLILFFFSRDDERSWREFFSVF